MDHINLDLTAIAQEGSENIERILLKHLSNENSSNESNFGTSQ